MSNNLLNYYQVPIYDTEEEGHASSFVPDNKPFAVRSKIKGKSPKVYLRQERTPEERGVVDDMAQISMGVWNFAKLMTRDRQKQYMNSRLGMIIDGTGHDYSKITAEKKKLESIGYDCYMVFVNTSLKIAQQRNLERTRRLPPKILKKSWQDVQNNLGKFQGLFRGNFAVVDNSKYLKPEDAQKKFGMIVKKYINNFIKKPVKNFIGKQWIKHQLILRSKK